MIRLLAWRETLGHGDEPDMVEPYDCERDCMTRGAWDDARRAARACARVDLPHVPPRPTAAALYDHAAGSTFMGRPATRLPVVQLGRQFPPGAAPEPVEDGCPSSWSRSPFAFSLIGYMRPRVGDGGRLARRAFDDAPEHVQDAVELYEREQERCIAHIADERERRRRLKRELADAQRAANAPVARGTARARRG